MNTDLVQASFIDELEKIAANRDDRPPHFGRNGAQEVIERSYAGRLDLGQPKTAAELTTEGREHIKKKNFALSAKQSDTGKPAYPIQDKSHAANALARVKQFGSPAEKSEVYKDVAKKFPELAARSDVPAVRAKAQTKTATTYDDVEAFGKKYDADAAGKRLKQAAFDWRAGARAAMEEGGPALGATLGAALAGAKGKSPLSGAAMGYGIGALPELLSSKKHK